MEKAFFWFEVEVVKLGDFEDVVDCASMIVHVCASGDPNVVHINSDSRAKGFVFEDGVTIDVVHHGLEGRWRISESEIHNCRFEESISGFECHFLLVSFADTYVVVPPSNIKLCVDMCVAKIADEIRDQGKGVLIPNGEGVDFVIILYWLQFAIFFADEEE